LNHFSILGDEQKSRGANLLLDSSKVFDILFHKTRIKWIEVDLNFCHEVIVKKLSLKNLLLCQN